MMVGGWTPSDVTMSIGKWPTRVVLLPNKAWKMERGLSGFEKLFWFQCFMSSAQIKTKIKNQWPLFSKTMLFDWLRAQVTCLWQLKQTNLKYRADPSPFFMPYLAEALPFLAIFWSTFWRQRGPAAYHHHH